MFTLTAAMHSEIVTPYLESGSLFFAVLQRPQTAAENS